MPGPPSRTCRIPTSPQRQPPTPHLKLECSLIGHVGCPGAIDAASTLDVPAEVSDANDRNENVLPPLAGSARRVARGDGLRLRRQVGRGASAAAAPGQRRARDRAGCADLRRVCRIAGRVHHRADPRTRRRAPHEPELHGRLTGEGGRRPLPGRSPAVPGGPRSGRGQSPSGGVAAEPGEGAGQRESGAGRAGDRAGRPVRGSGSEGPGRPASDRAGRRPVHAAGHAGLGQSTGARQRGPEQPRERRLGRGRSRLGTERAGQRVERARCPRERASQREDASVSRTSATTSVRATSSR